MRLILAILSSLLLAVTMLMAGASSIPESPTVEDTPEGLEFFEKEIRPILATHCYGCHGEQKQKGELRLDSRAAIHKGGETGAILKAGDAKASRLLPILRYEDDSLKMPPKGKLKDEEIALIEKWIAMGAPAAVGKAEGVKEAAFNMEERIKHWCYQPMRTHPVPAVYSDWARQPVDAFIHKKLLEAGLKPTAEVSKNVWLRRVTFTLTGLPPTIEEQKNFRDDTSDKAYEKVVDRLLASKAYSERWARHWMDLVRYADTLGHEFDFELPNAWQYRDYVIRAMASDVPYDFFVMEHLAGDLLPTPRLHPVTKQNESILGTAFYWFGEAKHSPVDVKLEEAHRVDNQIDVIGKAFLAQTISCARCHDHKFDAISTRDYYALYGILKSSRYQQVERHEAKGLDEIRKYQKQKLTELAEKWLREVETPEVKKFIEAYQSTEKEMMDPNRFEYWKRSGVALAQGDVPVTMHNDGKLGRIFPAGTIHSGSLGADMAGTVRSPITILEKDFLHVKIAGRKARLRLIVDGFHLIQDPIYGGLVKGINSDEPTWVRLDVGRWKGHEAYIEVMDGEVQNCNAPAPSDYRQAWFALEEVVESNTQKVEPKPLGKVPDGVASLKKSLLNLKENRSIDSPSMVDLLQKLRAKKLLSESIAGDVAVMKDIAKQEFAPCAADANGFDEAIFIRGNPQTKGPMVPRSLPMALGGELRIASGSGRLEMAKRLVSPDFPLLSRVIVNRVWHHHFGKGLVRTVDDFGRMGETPSHPELLDYLAKTFMTEGWSLKKLHKKLVLSSTFRQSSRPEEAAKAANPNNTLLHHKPLQRLEAEAIRDSLLLISGQLRNAEGGPSVPAYVTAQMDGRGKPPQNGPRDGDKKRTIYQAVRRNFLSPFLLAFDFPVPFTTIGKRTVSNVPGQSLALLNDPFVLDQAAAWATKTAKEQTTQAEQVRQMYAVAFCREPEPKEQESCLEFLKLNSLRDLAHALICSKEFIFIP